ncbi:hypothetical protein BG58_22800 [Caballeronia jiangsuensis]|nr:hypothetical protein BG58_22800 [Caballeronia jiangsuensis]
MTKDGVTVRGTIAQMKDAVAISATVETFVAGIDFTAGVSPSLTLAGNYASVNDLDIYADGYPQLDCTLSGHTLAFNPTVPAGISKVLVRGRQARAIGSPSDGTVTDAKLAAGSKAQNRTLTVMPQDFGALADGVHDDTLAWMSADVVARMLGKELYATGGIYMASQLVISTGSCWRGDGRQATIIKQIAGSNKDLFYGANSNANWGSSNPTNLVNGYTIQGMTPNGNWNGGAGNTVGSGLAVYGCRPILRDVFITNCAEHGMRTEYKDAAQGVDTFTMEGHFSKVQIDTVGKHGWWNCGPHDMAAFDVTVVDASQAAANTYNGFHLDANCTGGFTRLHAWTRAASLRMGYAIKINPNAQGDFNQCHFEGGWFGNAGIFSSGNTFDPTCHFYSAWNGVNIYMGLTATLNVIRGFLDAPGVGRPACIGILLGSNGSDFIADNDIDVKCASQEAGHISFTAAADGGNNKIRASCYNVTAATYVGIPHPKDDVDILFHSNDVTSHLNNRQQGTSVPVGPNTSVTWNFPIPFASAPRIRFTPVLPAGISPLASGSATGTSSTSRSGTTTLSR